ncbi:hypothetical protein BST26_15425 [Mycolicibacterium insubricum]|uniref:Uncharacterized protein n=1 Tax=Mycolicibacterium insubricum TaxID=444597 RepID=A0A1X0D5P5_9MYCO|nr:hypothetical protein BST26_15425 [Mycolicibacterium insubricum]
MEWETVVSETFCQAFRQSPTDRIVGSRDERTGSVCVATGTGYDCSGRKLPCTYTVPAYGRCKQDSPIRSVDRRQSRHDADKDILSYGIDISLG